ncbi:hypothetical protein [Allocoleopsis sp.]|uniref:hypothetical protein n=1 Tax=Allocoleopsis sp. TaxID=3088169 RepID=UPI002FD0EC4B
MLVTGAFLRIKVTIKAASLTSRSAPEHCNLESQAQQICDRLTVLRPCDRADNPTPPQSIRSGVEHDMRILNTINDA